MFPTVYSTLDPDALAAYVSNRYGLPACHGRLLLRGVGDTYLITSGSERFVLRVYRRSHRSLPNVEAEVALLTALREAGVSVSYPIADTSGSFIQAIDAAEGTRHLVLFTFAEGESPLRLMDDQLRQLGTEIGKFHKASSKVSLPGTRWEYNVFTTLDEPIRLATPWLNAVPDDLTWWIYAAERSGSELATMDTKNFSYGYCHYDFLPKNFHFDKDRVTLFDFDFLGSGWVVNDLMTFWNHLSLDVQFNRMTLTEAERSFTLLLDSYSGQHTINNEELRAIPHLSLAWWCYYMGFHTTHDVFSALVHPANLKMRTALIRQLTERNWTSFPFQ